MLAGREISVGDCKQIGLGGYFNVSINLLNAMHRVDRLNPGSIGYVFFVVQVI